MYKIYKDDSRRDRFGLKYFMDTNLVEPLYTMENLTWSDVQKHIKTIVHDHNDLTWMYDVVRLSNKQINLTDNGKWSIL